MIVWYYMQIIINILFSEIEYDIKLTYSIIYEFVI